MSERDYKPIACSLHDHLEAFATLRKRIPIVYRGADAEPKRIEDVIVDVFARAGAEFIRLEGGIEIRLDDLLTAGDVEMRPNTDR